MSLRAHPPGWAVLSRFVAVGAPGTVASESDVARSGSGKSRPIEIRSVSPLAPSEAVRELVPRHYWVNPGIDLKPGTQALWKGMERKPNRQAVGRVRRRGVSAEWRSDRGSILRRRDDPNEIALWQTMKKLGASAEKTTDYFSLAPGRDVPLVDSSTSAFRLARTIWRRLPTRLSAMLEGWVTRQHD